MVVQFRGLAGRPADQPDIDVIVGVDPRRPALDRVPLRGEQMVVPPVEDVGDALVGDPQQVGRAKPGGQMGP